MFSSLILGLPQKLPEGFDELQYKDLRLRLGLPSEYIQLKFRHYDIAKEAGYSRKQIDELRLRAAEGGGLDSAYSCCACCGGGSRTNTTDDVIHYTGTGKNCLIMLATIGSKPVD